MLFCEKGALEPLPSSSGADRMQPTGQETPGQQGLSWKEEHSLVTSHGQWSLCRGHWKGEKNLTMQVMATLTDQGTGRGEEEARSLGAKQREEGLR